MPKLADQFHLGVVTDDLEDTRARLSRAFGYEWGPEVGGVNIVNLADGEAELDFRCTFSTSVPRLELVRSIPGTLWQPATGGIHHIGFWSDDVTAESAELAAAGYVLEASRALPDGSPSFTYQRSPDGFRVELVNRLMEPGMSQCWRVS